MTTIRSQEKNFINLLIILLTIPLVFGIISLVVIYNQTVDLRHNISRMKMEMQKTETETAALKDQLFSIFDPQKVDTLAASHGLVKETRPNYLEVNSWALASHF